jgi:hypothetical protein
MYPFFQQLSAELSVRFRPVTSTGAMISNRADLIPSITGLGASGKASLRR